MPSYFRRVARLSISASRYTRPVVILDQTFDRLFFKRAAALFKRTFFLRFLYADILFVCVYFFHTFACTTIHSADYLLQQLLWRKNDSRVRIGTYLVDRCSGDGGNNESAAGPDCRRTHPGGRANATGQKSILYRQLGVYESATVSVRRGRELRKTAFSTDDASECCAVCTIMCIRPSAQRGAGADRYSARLRRTQINSPDACTSSKSLRGDALAAAECSCPLQDTSSPPARRAAAVLQPYVRPPAY